MILASASLLSTGLTAAVAVGYLLPAMALGRNHTAARLVVAFAWLLHALLLAAAMAGESPHFGFAPALSVTAWLVVALVAVESQFYPQLQIRWALGALGSVAVVLALVFPGAPLPALSSVWLPLHLALGIGSYGLFGVAVAHAWFMGRAEERIRMAVDPHSGLPLLTIERLTFRFVGAGFVLLSATLLLAFFFRESLYGASGAWRWDHKTIFSFLSWLTFAALLLGRVVLGWRGRRAARVLYAGAGLLFLAYVGSRFVLEVILGRVP